MSRVAAQVINYVNLHFNDPLSSEVLSEKFYVGKFHLSHEFNRQAGICLYPLISRENAF